MFKGILGRKLGMTQIFNEKGFSIPVTLVDVSGNVVLQQKNFQKDHYQATKLGFGYRKENKINKPLLGYFRKNKLEPKSFIKEIFFMNNEQNELAHLKVGQNINIDIFNLGDFVDVTSISKGKGFSGSIKRHNQSRGPETHGSRYHRRPGSMGPIKGNIKGKKLPGQKGCTKVTLQNLEIVRINTQKELLFIKGSVPGPKKSFLMIKSAVKKRMRV